MWKYIIAWVPMVFIAIANGIFREKYLSGSLKELHAHQISTIILIILFGIYIWILFRICRPESVHQAFKTGLLWLGLTLIFEFLFGHYIVGHPWEKLLLDYNILKGRLWVLVVIWISAAPYIIYKIQK